MPLVAIVGRPNVGKSTLFNRLVEARQAIVHDEPGVTRDRVYGRVEWAGAYFSVVDTGGFVPNSAEQFEAAIREQVHIAIEEADAVLFIVDVTTGITNLDQEMAEILRKTKKPVLTIANKADNEERRWQASEFYQLGLGEVYPVGSLSGTGTGELLDDLIASLPPEPTEEQRDDRLHVAIIGKPNVGKSSLANAILGFPRSIVTEIPGTTRDAIHSVIEFDQREMVLIDTAGLRRKSRVRENVEFYSALRTQRAIEECDVAVLLLDAVEGLQAQDIRVLKDAEEMRKGLVIAVNKWDLFEKETNTARDYERLIYSRLPMLDYVPIVFISAVTRQRVQNVLRLAADVDRHRRQRIQTSPLNDVMLKAIERHHPPTYRNQFVKIKYVTQVRERPPVFVFFCNYPRGVKENYRRYLENQLREAFDFTGVPLTLVFKAKSPERV
ncbi:MAG: ribosome biogenesis GTPase Der [Rhodothermales bacterium]